MKLFYLLVLVAVTKASFQDADFAGRILVGIDAVDTDDFAFRFLSVADILATEAKVSSGVAITPDFGLVVAQAVEGSEFFYVGFGSINVEDHDIQSIPRSNIIQHAGYDPITLRDNIAVLKFTTPVSRSIPVATLPPPFPVLLVFGYGFNEISSTIPTSILQQLIVLGTSEVPCDNHYDYYDFDASICATFPIISAFKGGDQGGPMVDQTRTAVHALTSYWSETVELLVGLDLIHYTPFIDASKAALED